MDSLFRDKYQFLILSKQTGNMWEASELITDIRFHTYIRENAGKFEFGLLKDDQVEFHEGDEIVFKVKPSQDQDYVNIFHGYVFTKEKDRWGKFHVVCYDQLRYLKARASYVFEGATATDVIRKIAQDFQLKTGTLADTGYRICAPMIQQNKSLLDIIYYGLQQTQVNTGKLYVFYDDCGALTLTEAKDMFTDVVLGNNSLVTDYKYKTDIDADTYNLIKLVQPNRKTGKGDVYIAEDSKNQAAWGILQKYEVVEHNLNPAQIQEQAEARLRYYNRVLRTLKLENCLGVLGLRAGHMVLIDMPDLGDISLSKRLLLDSVEHHFESYKHTMNVGMRVII